MGKLFENGVISPDTKTPGLQEAREKLKYYEMSNAERHAYDEHINAIMIQNDVRGMQEWRDMLKEELKEELKKKRYCPQDDEVRYGHGTN